MIPRSRALLAALLLAASVTPVVAGVPAPAPISTVPVCFAPCPLGDVHMIVIVRDFASNPIAGSSVDIDFSGCAGAFVCTFGGVDPYVYDVTFRRARMITDAAGRVDFPLRVGGVCGAGGVKLYADGVLLASYALASPDQDGDGAVVSVIGADDPTFAAKLGTSDPTADFDCDGYVDATDEQYFFDHHSHACQGYVDPARRGTWGSLKLHYR